VQVNAVSVAEIPLPGSPGSVVRGGCGLGAGDGASPSDVIGWQLGHADEADRPAVRGAMLAGQSSERAVSAHCGIVPLSPAAGRSCPATHAPCRIVVGRAPLTGRPRPAHHAGSRWVPL